MNNGPHINVIYHYVAYKSTYLKKQFYNSDLTVNKKLMHLIINGIKVAF